MWFFYHNVKIDFLMFICGLFFGVITLHLLFTNSVMLGCFQYMFFAKGLGIKSVLVIWVHGTLEISAMIISSTAGFIIAKSILFPGSYSRLSSFKTGIKDAVKIMIIFVPMTLALLFLKVILLTLCLKPLIKMAKAACRYGQAY